jgi:hypothetical protein
MPHAALKLVPGTDTQETIVQNEEGGIFSTQLIRFFYDRNGLALVAKLGGWSRFYADALPAIVRQLWAWEDLNATAHLAFGTQTYPSSGVSRAQLGVITNGVLQDITPLIASSSTAPVASTQAGSASVTLTDPNVTTLIGPNNGSVWITTPISVGGLLLYGLYSIDDTGGTGNIFTYTVTARDQLGNPLFATSTSTAAALPFFSTVAGSNIVTVQMGNYPYSVGDTFAVLVPIAFPVGGLLLFGNYVVHSLVDASHFTFTTVANATTTASGTYPFGLAQYTYVVQTGVGPLAKIAANDWTMDNWGDTLVACAILPGTPTFQPIYVWNPDAPTATASVIPQAPPVNDGIFVAMPQRQIVAWGSTQTGIADPLLIAWCDVGNYNVWIPTVTNQAGSYRIPKGSRIVGALQGPQQALIWTDIDVWSMQYIGPPYVYSFNEVGTGCGMVGRKAACAYEGIFYWMGFSQFFTLSSAGVQILPCTVWDTVFQNITANTAYYNNIRVAVNSRFGEITWYYPSNQSSFGENDSYVKYTVQLGLWDYGTLARSAWIDQSVLGPPIGADPNSLLLFQHETSNDADGAPMLPNFQTGYFAIGEGDVKSFVDWVWPDMKWATYQASGSASVQIYFHVKDYPTDQPTIYGPYTTTNQIEYFYTRFRGRLISVAISSNDLGTWWRLGLIRYRYAPDGRI